jgi:hypothetical protein
MGSPERPDHTTPAPQRRDFEARRAALLAETARLGSCHDETALKEYHRRLTALLEEMVVLSAPNASDS